mgnify:CR=1 FL=1
MQTTDWFSVDKEGLAAMTWQAVWFARVADNAY